MLSERGTLPSQHAFNVICFLSLVVCEYKRSCVVLVVFLKLILLQTRRFSRVHLRLNTNEQPTPAPDQVRH